jgi:hypothetical protein
LENPPVFERDLLQRVVALAAEVVKTTLKYPRAMCSGDSDAAVGAKRVQDDDVI